MSTNLLDEEPRDRHEFADWCRRCQTILMDTMGLSDRLPAVDPFGQTVQERRPHHLDRLAGGSLNWLPDMPHDYLLDDAATALEFVARWRESQK